MSVRFTKMHGLGNDFLLVDVVTQRLRAPEVAALAKTLCDRHRGVGADGLLLIVRPSAPDADLRMITMNADGSRAQMCGNGVRCVAKLAYDRGLTRKNPLRVQTDRGVLALDLTIHADGRVAAVRVDMGPPTLLPREIPVIADGERVVDVPFPLGGEPLRLTAVSMGNPHAVFFVPDVAAVPLQDWGPRVEHDPRFPERCNAHFVQVLQPRHVRVRTWERGAGATLACGTGASAVCVAGVLNGLSERRITAALPGGDLDVAWDEATNHVHITGPAVEVFDGEWPASAE